MKVSVFKRIGTAYVTIGKSFGIWFAPIISGKLILALRILIAIGMLIDWILFPSVRKERASNPIIIVGNPRSGTTFLHRFLVNNGIGAGSQLWQLLYPSIVIQKIIKPFLPILEKISPTRHHSTVAHKTSLSSVETDDASILFRFFDGFFLYGFILSWNDGDLMPWIDPKIRSTLKRDSKWLESIWRRTVIQSGEDRIIPKMFSISTNIPEFLKIFPDSHLLYMLRDPMSVIPSGLSLVTGVLDKRFGFWSLPKEKRQRYIDRLYKALIELQIRFQDDWVNNRIDKKRLMIVKFDRMMTDFEGLMDEINNFIGHSPSDKLLATIKETSEKQRNFKSKHKYDLEKFGLTEEMIRKDCAPIYETFFND